MFQQRSTIRGLTDRGIVEDLFSILDIYHVPSVKVLVERHAVVVHSRPAHRQLTAAVCQFLHPTAYFTIGMTGSSRKLKHTAKQRNVAEKCAEYAGTTRLGVHACNSRCDPVTCTNPGMVTGKEGRLGTREHTRCCVSLQRLVLCQN